MVSGRVSFEIVQKAAVAGIPIIAAVSAPSDLAIETAERLGVTLIGFLRGDGFNVYTHDGRIDLRDLTGWDSPRDRQSLALHDRTPSISILIIGRDSRSWSTYCAYLARRAADDRRLAVDEGRTALGPQPRQLRPVLGPPVDQQADPGPIQDVAHASE
jgi:hypothetical protein